MAHTWNLASGLAVVAVASAAAFGLCPNAAADPAPPDPTQQLAGLPGLAQLSPLIQQAAGNPEQTSQLLMAAASALTRNSTTPDAPASASPAAAASVPHVPPVGVEPGAQAHLPTGIDPLHAAGPTPQSAPLAAPTADVVPQPAAAPAANAVPAAAAFGPEAPPTQDFMYPSIGNGCLPDGSNSIATALSVAGPATIPLPGPGPSQTAYVFTAVGTSGPAEIQKLPLNVTWVNLTTGKSGSATLKPRSDINPDGPTTLTAIADTGSGSIISTIFGQITTKDKQCQFMPTVGSAVVP